MVMNDPARDPGASPERVYTPKSGLRYPRYKTGQTSAATAFAALKMRMKMAQRKRDTKFSYSSAWDLELHIAALKSVFSTVISEIESNHPTLPLLERLRVLADELDNLKELEGCAEEVDNLAATFRILSTQFLSSARTHR